MPHPEAGRKRLCRGVTLRRGAHAGASVRGRVRSCVRRAEVNVGRTGGLFSRAGVRRLVGTDRVHSFLGGQGVVSPEQGESGTVPRVFAIAGAVGARRGWPAGGKSVPPALGAGRSRCPTGFSTGDSGRPPSQSFRAVGSSLAGLDFGGTLRARGFGGGGVPPDAAGGASARRRQDFQSRKPRRVRGDERFEARGRPGGIAAGRGTADGGSCPPRRGCGRPQPSRAVDIGERPSGSLRACKGSSGRVQGY